MEVNSLGYRTDLIFAAYNGEITDRGAYLVIRTPSNPGFFWGNFLLFKDPPGPGDDRRWRALFNKEIGGPPEVKHETFGWDSPDGDTGDSAPFTSAGFTLLQSEVLAAQEVHLPAHPNSEVTVRPLAGDADWQQAIENQIFCREPEHSEGPFREFKTRQFDRYRRMSTGGLGDWFGAFLGDRLVADLGIFHDGSIARFQNVETHPDFRRRGIAATLVYRSSLYALEHYAVRSLVIVADRDSAPARMYAGVGYRLAERQVGLERWEE